MFSCRKLHYFIHAESRWDSAAERGEHDQFPYAKRLSAVARRRVAFPAADLGRFRRSDVAALREVRGDLRVAPSLPPSPGSCS